MVSLKGLETNGKALYLAYDQGLEHGPTDFNQDSVHPEYILDLGVSGEYNGVILQKGVAEKYYTNSQYQNRLPLILKLNGKTSYIKQEPYAPLLCTVEEALALGASAVGYTVYVGSQRQDEMFSEFGEIVRTAHAKDIPVFGWMYPRGSAVLKETAAVTAYAARTGLELGADVVKVKFHPDVAQLKAIVTAAGKTKVVFSGGPKVEEAIFMEMVKLIAKTDAFGLAVGRNIWQSGDPLKLTKSIMRLLT